MVAFNFSPERFHCGQLVGARPRTASKLELGARVCPSSRATAGLAAFGWAGAGIAALGGAIGLPLFDCSGSRQPCGGRVDRGTVRRRRE
jgi:hypothetical protein